jgi:hypothetical protein
MTYDFPLRASEDYTCPPNASPEWRSAYAAGIDMAELEANLELSPWERLQKNDRAIADHKRREAFLKILRRGAQLIHSKSWRS